MVRGPQWRKGSLLSRRRYSCAGKPPRGERILALARDLFCLRSSRLRQGYGAAGRPRPRIAASGVLECWSVGVLYLLGINVVAGIVGTKIPRTMKPWTGVGDDLSPLADVVAGMF